MSVASEIARIAKNVTDSLAEVALKGVTVPSGSTSDDLPELIAAIQQGSGSAVVVTEEPDQNGGVIKNITAVDISSDTVDAAHLVSGYTAHDRLGQAITGSMGNATLIASITDNEVPYEDSWETYYNSSSSKFTISHVLQRYAVVEPVTQAGYIGTNAELPVMLYTSRSYELANADPYITVDGAGFFTSNNARRWRIRPRLIVDVSEGDTAGYLADGTNKYGEWEEYNAIPSNTTITPTESQQTIGGQNYMLEGAITVSAISSNYIGSGITTRSSSDLTASGATVTVPAGYYSSQATKSVTTMTLPTSATSSATSGYTSKATISRSTSDQYINIAPGYNSAGGYYKISAVANGSVTAPASISGSSATVSTGTNTLTLTKTVSVTPSVTTAGYISSGTAGNASVSLTASVTTKGTTTYATSTTDVTIASGTYITGTQTIKAVTTSGITAANIKAGTTVKVGDSIDDDRILGITGTFTSDATAAATDIVSGKSAYVNGSKVDGSLVIQHYYTGSSTPLSTLGVNGDIYLKTS